jgi:hypothetical protein
VIYDPVITSGDSELTVKDDFVDEDKENGKQVNVTVEVTA